MTRSIFANCAEPTNERDFSPSIWLKKKLVCKAKAKPSGPKREEPLTLDSLPRCLNALSISFAAKQSAMASRTVESLGMRWPKTTNPVVRPKKLTPFLGLSNFGSGNWWPTSRPRTNHPATPSTELFLIGRPKKLLCAVWRRGLALISTAAGSTRQPTHSVREPTAAMFA